MSEREFVFALEDYQRARRRAALQEMLARIKGTPEDNQLLSYQEVRKRLHAIEKSSQQLQEIPLDAIVGSVDRYTDFNRKFLPRKSISPGRWARVMAFAKGLTGLPPIEVYQIGEVYFVKDGNHRVSVARQMGSKLIQAYVTRVETKVPVTPDLNPDQLIIKAEQVSFLEKTRLDQLRPDADLTATTAGAYPAVLEHIDVHRYFMGLEREKEIPYPEAVTHWYDQVYLPVVRIIRRRGLLREFSERTETDLYLWVSRHRHELGEDLGWDIGSDAAAQDLAERHPASTWKKIRRWLQRLRHQLTPDPLQSGPPPGTWRIQRGKETQSPGMFRDILVGLDDSPRAWKALDQALVMARLENSGVHGVHIHPEVDPGSREDHSAVEEKFTRRCQEEHISRFNFRIRGGEVSKVLCRQARFMDLVVLPLNYPPGEHMLVRLESGLRAMIRSCPQPILTVPGRTSPLDHVVLAYDSSPKSREALYIAAYLAGHHASELTVLTSSVGLDFGTEAQEEARSYLTSRNVEALYVLSEDPLPESIRDLQQGGRCDLILIGGYGAGPVLEVVLGSVVDRVLREVQLPALICR